MYTSGTGTLGSKSAKDLRFGGLLCFGGMVVCGRGMYGSGAAGRRCVESTMATI